MRVFVAGATGAIGQPLIAELIRQGHTVTGMARSDSGTQVLKKLGATVAMVNAFDAMAVEAALKQSRGDVVIDQLTSLPKNPADMASSAPGDRKLRLEGSSNLLHAALACGVRRYIQQSSGFFFKPGSGLADESEEMAVDASPGVATTARTYAQVEARLLGTEPMEGVALRYGFFYGPNTWYCLEGACADQARRREISIIGKGEGVWSWIHIEDAAFATVAALTIPPGIYNVVNDDPSPVNQWLPAFTRFVGAPTPPQISEEEARKVAGEDAVYYGTKLRGASNAKSKATFDFRPRRLQWLTQ